MQTLALTADEIEAWLRLVGVRGIGPVTARRLLAAFGLPPRIFEQSHATLAHVAGEEIAYAILRARDDKSDGANYARVLEWEAAPNNHFLTLADPAYPRALFEMTDPPLVLYVKGRLEQLHAPSLAIVGSRHASAPGLQNASQFARALADAGFCIVSGLALGIDGAAHQGALDSEASTVAVIGTGIDLVYPARHHALAQRIATAGAIVAEWPLGTPARAVHFPRRNRLIAGLTQGVLVIEAAAQSGSLITARLAGEMGREVFALPGSIHSPLTKGCHRLIKEGAKLVESVQDVLDELRPAQTSQSVKTNISKEARKKTALEMGAQQGGKLDLSINPLDAVACRVLEALGYDPSTLEELVVRTGLDSAELQATLFKLEMERHITLLPGGRVMRLLQNG